MNFGDLAYPDVRDATAVHLLPLGATEPHGPHAPLVDRHADLGRHLPTAPRSGSRARSTCSSCRRCPTASRATGRRFPGAVSIGEETLRSLVTEIAGDRRAALVLVNSHFEPEQVETLRATGLPLLDLTRRKNAERLTDEFRSGSCHAGRYETSLVLADRPELVHARPDAWRSRSDHVDMPAAIRAGQTDFVAMGMDEAYCGSPAEATAEEGRADLRDADGACSSS